MLAPPPPPRRPPPRKRSELSARPSPRALAGGAHARDDFQSRDDENWMKHTLSYQALPSDEVKLDYRPVHFYTLDEEECPTVALAQRVY